MWVGALLYVPTSPMFFLIGTGLFAFYRRVLACCRATSPRARTRSFRTSWSTHLPTWTGGSARRIGLRRRAVDDLDQHQLVGDAHPVRSLRAVRPADAPRAERLTVLRVSSLVIGLGGTRHGPRDDAYQDRARRLVAAGGHRSGGMLGLFLLGFLSPARAESARRGGGRRRRGRHRVDDVFASVCRRAGAAPSTPT